jgi:hypothetical protein
MEREGFSRAKGYVPKHQNVVQLDPPPTDDEIRAASPSSSAS